MAETIVNDGVVPDDILEALNDEDDFEESGSEPPLDSEDEDEYLDELPIYFEDMIVPVCPYASQPEYNIVIYDDTGRELVAPVDDAQPDYAEEMEFMDPDAHELFLPLAAPAANASGVKPAAEGAQGRQPRRSGRTGQGRGGRVSGKRERGAHAGLADANATRWQRGNRLREVCLSDDDVPEELRRLVMNVMDVRRARENATRRQNERRVAMEDDEDDADFLDAVEGEDLVAGEFDWRPMDSFQGQREIFVPDQTGPLLSLTDPYDAFRSFWDDGILSHVVEETNRYAHQICERSPSFLQQWYDTNVSEILILFSFYMMLGIVKMPSINSCFTLNPLLKTEVFRTMFTQKRFWNVHRALHFVDNATRTPQSDTLFSFGPILDHLNAKFKEHYVPQQNICIDESLTLWKGHLSFKQYIKTKSAKFGIKTFELCESATGYLWSFFVYTGKNSEGDSTVPVSTQTVLRLISPLLNKGYTLFMDNWFNSPALARYLKANKTDCVGTLRPSRRGVPPLVALAKLREGEYLARNSGDVTVMAFQDKKKVVGISTYHGSELGQTGAKPHKPSSWKPQLVLDYNIGMGGVDRKDQMLEPYELERKRCAKWYMKLFKRLLNASILNARIVHDASRRLKYPDDRQMDHILFRLKVVQQILEKHLPLVPASRSIIIRPSNVFKSSRLTGRNHWVAHIPQSAEGEPSRNKRLTCMWCSKRHHTRHLTSWRCESCDVALCIPDCFKQFHTQV